MRVYLIVEKPDGTSSRNLLTKGFKYVVNPGEKLVLVNELGTPVELPLAQDGEDLIVQLADNKGALIENYFVAADQSPDLAPLPQEDPVEVSLIADQEDTSPAEALTAATAPDDSFSLMRFSQLDYIGFDNGSGGIDNSLFSDGFVGAVAADEAPIAETDFTADLDEDNSIRLNLLANDRDPEGGAIRLTAIEGTGVGVDQTITLPSGGEVTFLGGGQVEYNPGDSFQWVAEGETAVDTFTYTIADEAGNETSATVTVNIEGVNDDPTAVEDEGTGDEDTPVTVNVLENDLDPDLSNTFSVIDVSPTQEGTVSFTPEGEVTFDPGDDFQHLSEGETATVIVEYTMSDNDGGTSTAALTFTVTGVNDNPVATEDTVAITEDKSINIDLIANDSDVESDPLTVTEINGRPVAPGVPVTLPSGGQVTLQPDGTVTYDPNDQYEGLGTGDVARDVFTYTVDDGNGGTEVATVTVDIDGVNDGPVITANTVTLEEGETIPITTNEINAEDPDHPPAELTFSPNHVTGGQFLVSGLPSLTFTLQDILDGLVEYEHDGGEIPPSWDLVVSDPEGLTDQSPLNANYTPINDAPDAIDDTGTTVEDNSIDVTLIGNDSDAENDPLTISKIDGSVAGAGVPITLASGATVTSLGNGDVTYDPNDAFESLTSGESAIDTFTYEVDDGNGGTDVATVTMTIDGVNDGPTIDNHILTLEEGEKIPITPAEIGASDPDHGPEDLTFTVSNPVGGQFLLNGVPTTTFTQKDIDDGLVQYEDDGSETPPAYDLTVTDPGNLDDQSPLDLNYTPINDVPDAIDDGGSTDENTAANVDLVGNDSDAENDPLTIAKLDGTFASVGVPVTLASGATVMSLGNGSVEYDPNNSFESLIDGQTATDTFTYEITDGNGGTDVATVTMTINGVNDGPTIDRNTLTIAEGQTIPITSAEISATDPDHGSPDLTFTVTNPAGGQFLLNGVPTTTFTQKDIDDGLVQYEDDGSETPPSYTLTVTDPGNLSDQSPLDLNYTPINDAPDAVDDNVTITEDQTVNVPVIGNDTDAEHDPLSITAANGAALTPGVPFPLSSGSEITLLGGEIKFDPKDTYQDLGSSDTAVETFTYTINDGEGGIDTATVTVTINGVNDGPVAGDDSGLTNEDSPITGLDLLANDLDAEDGTPVLQKIGNQNVNPGSPVTLPSGATVTPDANGKIDYDPNGRFEHLSSGETATETFTYTVVDTEGATSTATTTITINGVNDSPDAINDVGTTDQNTVENIAVLSNDSDPENQTLNVTDVNSQVVAVGVPATIASGATVTLQPNGTFNYDPNGQFDHLSGTDTAVDTFTYEVSDGAGGVDVATVTVTVNGVNDTPDAVNDALTVDEDGTVNYDLRTNDTDPDGDNLTVTQINGSNISANGTATLPSGALVTLNPDGTIDYDPNDQFELPLGQTATDTFSYRVSDGNGGFDVATANVTIDGTNDAPVANDDFSLGNTPGRPVIFDVASNDTDIDGTIDPTTVDLDPSTPGITTTLTVPGEGVWETNGQGQVTFTPEENLQGNPTPVSYSVQDNDGLTSTGSGNLTVTYANFDLWFGNDLSGSVNTSEYEQSRVLISGMADLLPFSESNGAKAGLFSWAQTGSAVLNQSITADDNLFVNTALTYPRPFGGGTNIDYAINFGVQQIQASLQAGGGGRSYADQVLLILTDASPSSQIVSPQAAIINAANAAKAAGITLGFIAIQEAQSTQAALDVLSQAASLDASGQPLLMTAPTYAGIDQAQIINIIAGLAPAHAYNIVNQPILAVGDSELVAENGTVSLDPINNDNHVSNDVLTLTEIDTIPIVPGGSVTLTSGAIVTMNGDGSLTYDPSGQFGALNNGDAQADIFQYTVIDQSGNSETGNIGITVEGVSGVPPVVIDMDGDGTEFDGIDEGIRLDVDGDGIKEQTAWASEDDAVLIYDQNSNQAVDGPDEFAFSNYADNPNATDLEGLTHFDSYGDHTLDADDAEFSKFKLWQDADGDGEVGEGEMVSLMEAGINSISLESDNNSYTTADGDVLVHGEAEVQYNDGTTGVAADAEFHFEELIEDDEEEFEVITNNAEALGINSVIPPSCGICPEGEIVAPPVLQIDDQDLI